MKCDVLIIDGRHALWRTSDAFKELSVEIGDHTVGTGGMYGFLCLATRIHQRYGGKVMVAWEGKGNFRKVLYPPYKDKGESTQEQLDIIHDMGEQEKRLMAILRALGVQQYYGDGCEADDVIGRLAKEESKKGHFVLIYSGDSDLRQLVNSKVHTVSPGRRGKPDVIYDKVQVEEKHGVPPCLIADLKALAGDSSDKIPGVRGIGEKTAVKLIQAFGDFRGVIRGAKDKSSEWPVSPRFREMIINERKNIKLYMKLTTIKEDAGMKAIVPKRNKVLLIKHFMVYRFVSLLASSEMHELLEMA